jgi:protein-tyrosine-phosphatase
MAAGFLTHLAGDRIEVRSAGSLPADRVNPAAVEAMKEVGVDITGAAPKVLTTEAVQASDYVITMGCGDACPVSPARSTSTGRWRTRPDRASRRSDPSATGSGPASRP